MKDYFVLYEKYINSIDAHKKDLLNHYFNNLFNEAMQFGYIGEAEADVIWLRHILDSLLPLQNSKVNNLFLQAKKCIDLGTGAGLPGIVLAILFPHCQFQLIDSSEKRVRFLEKIKSELNLFNLVTLCNQVDTVILPENEKADLVTYRAFRKPLASLELALYAVRKNGKVLYWRSNQFEYSYVNNSIVELFDVTNRIKQLGYQVNDFIKLDCPEELVNRGLYIFHHHGNNDKVFPRKWPRIIKDKLVERIL